MARITTPNRGWSLPDLDEPANVPGDLGRLANDADIDMQVAFREISRDTGWQNVTLNAGYVPYSTSYAVQVRKVRANHVFLAGGIKTTSDIIGGTTLIGRVPAEFAPERITFCSQRSSGRVTYAIYVDTVGDIRITYHDSTLKAGDLLPLSMSWITAATQVITDSTWIDTTGKTGSTGAATDGTGGTGGTTEPATYDSNSALAAYVSASGQGA